MDNLNKGSNQPQNSKVNEHLNKLKEEAVSITEDVKAQGKAQVEHYGERAAEQLDNLARGARSAVAEIDSDDPLGLAQYVSSMAERLSTAADNLRGKSTEELLQQAGRFARENPVLFLAGTVAIGYGLSQMLRSARTHDTPELGDSTYQSSSQGLSASDSQARSAEYGNASAAASNSTGSNATSSSTNGYGKNGSIDSQVDVDPLGAGFGSSSQPISDRPKGRLE
ncbi:hypothetical protein ACX0MV_07790 [Pseudomonas borbori]